MLQLLLSRMNKIKTLINTSRENSIRSLNREIKDYFLARGGAKYTKTILGKRYHHKLYMYDRLGYWPKIKNPRTFNEKIIHRKLYTNNDLFSTVEDKWRVREYVAENVGTDILPEVYHVTDDPDTIPFDELPEQYVIKPTHMSGPVIFVDDDDELNRDSIKQSCHKWINTTYGTIKEEYWYRDMKPRIIIEERLNDKERYVPNDYKVYVFHGGAEIVAVYRNRFDEQRETTKSYYDKDWNYLDVRQEKYKPDPNCPEPAKLNELLETAEVLAEDFNFIRVDFYITHEKKIV